MLDEDSAIALFKDVSGYNAELDVQWDGDETSAYSVSVEFGAPVTFDALRAMVSAGEQHGCTDVEVTGSQLVFS